MARIYVSSTFSDLEDFRKAVGLALRRLGHEDVSMEYYVAGDERPLERVLADVATCKLYVGIFAWRYGYIPPENNPGNRAITELEYRQAREVGIPCLIFMLAEEAPWPRTKQDKGPAADRIEALRQELSEKHVVSFFANADELSRKVNEAVTHWEKEAGLGGRRQLTDWDAYRQAVCNRHRWVRLQVIAGVSKDRGVTRIPLTEVFEPQLAAAGASRRDVPDEVRRYQEVIYGPRLPAFDEAALAEPEEPEAAEERVEPETDESLLSSNPELVLDVVGREPAQVILGGPGSGKSTILHYTMLRICQTGVGHDMLPLHLQAAPVPFLIELRNYVLQKAPDFISYIVQNSRAFYDATVEAESVIAVLEQEGQAMVYFDGLDEVFDPDDRRRVIDQFQTFAHRYPLARLIVTSRIAGYDRTALGLAGFQHYTLLPLTLGQIRHFASQWYQYYTLEGTDRTAQGLVQRIIENPRLLDLAGNPLLLTMMAVIYKDRDLPNERWRLYERCAETMLEDWDLRAHDMEVEDFKLAVLIRTAQKSEILQRVAMYMLEHGQQGRELNAIAYAPLLDIVAGYLVEKYQRSQGDAEAVAVDILRHLMERTYVLAGIGERVFGFVHRTFMEYFAACRCKAQFNTSKSDFGWLTRDIFGAHWQGDQWEEVLLLLIAMLHDQGTPIQEVVDYLRSECRTTVPFNLSFAARCLGEAGDVKDQVHGQALLAEVAQAITEYAPRSRKEEARTFVKTALGSFAALAPLVTAPAAVQKAVDRLNQTGTVAGRMAAWQMGFALRSHKDRLDYALAALQDTEEAVRRGAIEALEREWPGRPDIGPMLADVVRNDRQPRVKQAALATMQRSWRYEPAILDAIASRVNEETAYTYVTRLIEYLALTWRANPKARDLVVKLAGRKPKARDDYDYASVAEAAGKALMQGWRDEALPALQNLGQNHEIALARLTVIRLIVENWREDPSILQWLIGRGVQDKNAEVRLAAIQLIAKGWPGDTQAHLLLRDRATQDESEEVRQAALEAIVQGWSTDDQTLPWLRDLAARDKNSEVRQAAIKAIVKGWAGDAQTLLWLRDLATHDKSAKVCQAAIKAIAQGWPGDAQTLPWLRDRAAQEKVAGVRQAAIKAMAQGWPGDAQTLPWLRERAAQDKSARVREVAIKAIAQGWAGDAQTLQWLRDLTAVEKDAGARKAILMAIAQGWRADAQTLPFLEERATNDPDPETRSAVIQAIVEGWRGNTQALSFLQDQAINDPDLQSRAAMYRAIAEGWKDNAQALAFLQERAGNDPDLQTRTSVYQILVEGWRGNAQAWAFLQDRATASPEPEVRMAVLNAIADGTETGLRYLPFSFASRHEEPVQAVSLLRDRALNDPDVEVRASIFKSLARLIHFYYRYFRYYRDFRFYPDIHEPAYRSIWDEVLAFLQDRAANDPDAQIRVIALRAIGIHYDFHDLGEDAQTLAFLREQAVAHPSAETRADALWAIAEIWADRQQALTFLQERAINDPEPQTRQACLQAIGSWWRNDARALAFLENQAANNPDG